MGRRPAADVRAGLDLPGRPTRVPHRRDRRRPRALHRHGPRLERPRRRRQRPRRDPRDLQRDLPGRRLRAARLVLPERAPRPARPRQPGLPGRDLGGRAHRPDLPRHPAHRRLPDAPLGPAHARSRVVRGDGDPADRADHALRPALHDRPAVRHPGRRDHRRPAHRRADRAAAARLLPDHVDPRLRRRPGDEPRLSEDRHDGVHRGVQRLRAGHRRRRRRLGRDLRPGARRRRRTAHRGARPRRPRLRRAVAAPAVVARDPTKTRPAADLLRCAPPRHADRRRHRDAHRHQRFRSHGPARPARRLGPRRPHRRPRQRAARRCRDRRASADVRLRPRPLGPRRARRGRAAHDRGHDARVHEPRGARRRSVGRRRRRRGPRMHRQVPHASRRSRRISTAACGRSSSPRPSRTTAR